MYEFYDISETAFREFSNKHYIHRDAPVGSYCAVAMSFTTDDVHPLVFCVFDISDTSESLTISCNDLYEHDKQAYLTGIKSKLYANDYEVWHIVPDAIPFPVFYDVRGYVAEDSEVDCLEDDLTVKASFYSYRLAVEFAYTIYNNPCYLVLVRSLDESAINYNHVLTLKSERHLYSHLPRLIHKDVSHNPYQEAKEAYMLEDADNLYAMGVRF